MRSTAYVSVATVFLFLLFLANPVHALSLWWDVSSASETDWETATNWKEDPGGATGTPNNNRATYITTSDHPFDFAFVVADLPTASATEIGPLYVGGWGSEFDADHGDPFEHEGELEILAGDLQLGSHPSDCDYMRIGWNGARGTIYQYDGGVETCNLLTFAGGSPKSVGIWNLYDGEIRAKGLDIGLTGTGILDMRGGALKPHPLTTLKHYIGKGYFTDDEGYNAGVGLLNQTGGDIYDAPLSLGVKDGSVGIAAVRGGSIGPDPSQSPELAPKNLHIGGTGLGALVLTGGVVTADYIFLGYDKEPTGFGQLTVSGGELYADDFFNARNHAVSARGQFSVQGSGWTIEFDTSYNQAAEGMLSVALEPGTSPLGVIDGGANARFYSGSLLNVEILGTDSSPTSPYSPTEGEKITIMEADNVSDFGLAMAPGDEDWDILVEAAGSREALKIVYCPTGATHTNCL